MDSFLTPFGAIFAIIGLVFLLIGVAMATSGRRFRRRAQRTEGTIVGMKATDPSMGSAGFRGSIVYRPTVTFTMPHGQQVRATSRTGSNPRPGRVGQTVGVLYDPRNPQHIQVDSVRGRGTCLEVAFMFIGGVFAAIGIAGLLLAGR